MTEATQSRLPSHLRRYLTSQNYDRYTSEDQAVWRYIMRQLKNFLSRHAHVSYLEGLQKSGLQVERIPRIEVIDQHLERFGWGAVPVSGFIPPAAFMEFQALGILPIACDMRTMDHLLYTPAPDIVHEAGGHAPILVNPEYGAYLRQYGEVARRSIISKEDMAQYEAIRGLSDLKENPASTAAMVQQAEAQLADLNRQMKSVSEAALLSRMNWWTAEYGLIGRPSNPKIFGAGLLSSVGESRACLEAKVKKIPLSVDCVNYAYDITEPQPQLFVAAEFAQLGQVLEDLAGQLAYRRGGLYGLQRALDAESVNTIQLNSGIQIAGRLKAYKSDGAKNPIYLQFTGPCQLAYDEVELANQSAAQHAQGFSTPLGVTRQQRCLSTYSDSDLHSLHLRRGERASLEFQSGVKVAGLVRDWLRQDGRLILISWQDVRVTLGDELLFDPNWGDFDMAVGSQVTSVFAGPADRLRYGELEDFVAKTVPARSFSAKQLKRHDLFRHLRALRDSLPQKSADTETQFQTLCEEFLAESNPDWLLGVELLELGLALGDPVSTDLLRRHLAQENFFASNVRSCVRDGLELAALAL